MTQFQKLTPQDFLHFQKEVENFNTLMGNSVKDKTLPPTYQNLSIEELTGKDELINSILREDRVGIIDGLIDEIFTCFYYNRLQGYHLEDLSAWIETVAPVVEYFEVTPLQHAESILTALHRGNSLVAICQLISLILREQNNYNIRGAFEEVLRSNLSKLVKAEKDVDTQGEVAYILSQGRYADITVETMEVPSGKYYAFKARQDLESGVTFSGNGKLVKSSQFSEADLERFVL